MARIRPHAQLIGAAAIALLVGAAAGAVVVGSGGGTSTVTDTRTRVTVAVRTVTRTRVKTVPARPSRIAGTQSRGSAPGSSPASSSSAAPAGSSPVASGPPPGPPQNFAGTGRKTLGDITVKGTAILRWTNSSGRFRILFDANAVGVDSTAHSGRTVAPPQTYHQVKVDTPGRWTITIS